MLVALWRGSEPAHGRWPSGALAAWSSAVWVVRDVRILVADHEVGFKVVHTVLAVVSIVLAVLAWREVRRASRPTRTPRSGHADRPTRPRA